MRGRKRAGGARPAYSHPVCARRGPRKESLLHLLPHRPLCLHVAHEVLSLQGALPDPTGHILLGLNSQGREQVPLWRPCP